MIVYKFSTLIIRSCFIVVLSILCCFASADIAPVVNANPVDTTTQTTNQSVNTTVIASNQKNSAWPTIATPSTANTSSSSVDTSNMTDDQRLTQLEQQMNNLVKMNLAAQVTSMQSHVQALAGQVQVQKKLLAQLQTQQHDFYQQVDSRISQLNTLINNASTTQAASTSSTPAAKPIKKTTKQKKKTSDVINKQNNVSQKIASLDTNDSPLQTSKQKQLTSYQAAFSYVLNNKLAQAKKAFQVYMSAYPKGKYIVNAHYWLGEIAMKNKDYIAANNEFNAVVMQFPNNQKVADARLKLANIAVLQGNDVKAKQAFINIIHDYPSTPAAQLAQVSLDQLNG